MSGAEGPYVGHDRRQLVPTVRDPGGRRFVRSGAVLLVLWVVLALGTLVPDLAGVDLVALSRTVDAASMGVALVAATLTVVHWRLTRDARALWIGVGFALLSIASMAVAESLPLSGFSGLRTETLAMIRPASLLVVLGVLVQALRTAPVDERIHPGLLYSAAFGAVGLVALAFNAVPGLGDLWQFGSGAPADANPWAPGISAVAWLLLATGYCLTGLRRGRHLLTYCGLLLFGLTLAELGRALAVDGTSAWIGAASIMRMASVVVGFMGVTAELRLVFARLSTRLFEVNIQHQTSEARHRAQQEQARERAHEARNALTAIEGATRTLERHRDRLDPKDQQLLAQAVSSEIGRLQSLVTGSEQEPGQTVVFRLSDVVQSQVALARSRGITVLTEGPGDLYAIGRPNETAEALQNLLTNAERHAPGSPVTVRTRAERDHVTVRVEDRGPGIRPSARDAVFDRGFGASSGSGSGLGLFVSRQLLRDQQGHLWYEDHPGGGACFAFRLPAHHGASSQPRTDTSDRGGRGTSGTRISAS